MGNMKELKEMKEKVRKNNKGFSLVELIIVIAIMAILVGIIGSQLVPYMDKARKSKDLSTLDTIYTSFQTAIADNAITTDITADGLDTATTGLIAVSPSVAGTVKTLLGGSMDADSEINGKFKSKDGDGGNVKFTYKAATGEITVTKDALSVSNQ
jgi:type IV pilus assembly protein PilA